MNSSLIALPFAYLIGSIPSGLLIVRAVSGKDVRRIESGRTGGTNAMRAAGLWAGLATALMDIGKGALSVWLGTMFSSGTQWIAAISGFLAVIGHNYSIFLLNKDDSGKIRLTGGAGGAVTLGASIGLWAGSWMIILPLAVFFYVLIGYASLTTISIALSASGLFIVRALNGKNPWAYAAFSLSALLAVLIALRPNLERIRKGTERRVRLLARIFKEKKESKEPND